MKKICASLLLLVLSVVLIMPQATEAEGKTIFSFRGDLAAELAFGRDGNLRIAYHPYDTAVSNQFLPYVIATVTPEGKQISSWKGRGLLYRAKDKKGNELLYVHEQNHRLVAYNAKYQKLWSVGLGKGTWVDRVDRRGNLYVWGSDRQYDLYWKITADGRKIQYPKAERLDITLSEDGKYAYQMAAGKDRRQSVLRGLKEDGKIAWQQSPFSKTYKKTKHAFDRAHLVLADDKGTVYAVATYGKGRYAELHAFNLKGKRLWKKDISGTEPLQFGVAGSTLFYESNNDRVVLADRVNGKTITTLKVQRKRGEPLKIFSHDNLIYLADGTGPHTYSNKGRKFGTFKITSGRQELGQYTFDQKGRLYAEIFIPGSETKSIGIISSQGKLVKRENVQKGQTVVSLAPRPDSEDYYVFLWNNSKITVEKFSLPKK